MDQLKEFLRQAIKYRFWIAVGIACLLPVIAYAVGSGPIKKKADDETKKILGAVKGVEPFRSPGIPNAQYKPLVDQKKVTLSKDVNTSWRKLYSQQAPPLLTWPETVEQRFKDWGRKWPENVDSSAVQIAIIDYVQAYPAYVSGVYQTLHAFDAIEGTGVVAAPPESQLLKPAPFSSTIPPTLGNVWAAQERLWVQRALLQVIADVNKGAKDWDSAAIKQLNMLEVGTHAAEDQISAAKGVALEESAPLDAPGAPPPAADAAAAGQPQEASDSVFYVKTDSTQYKILPVALSVLVDQDRLPDFLVALENSPLEIQVIDFDMAKPSTRVTKPVKGETMNGTYMPGAARPMFGGPRMTAFGGGIMPRPATAFSSAPASQKKGVDRRGFSREEQKKLDEERAKKGAGFSLHDPYYYIVEVNVYGQARFYNTPPVEPTPEPSQAEAAAAAAPEPAKTEPATATTPAAADAAKEKSEPAKPADAPKAGGEPAKGEEAKAKGEPAKAEPAKGEPAKAEPAKGEPSKGEPAKAADAPKGDGEPAKAKEEPSKAKDQPAKDATPKT